jgi:O-antigen ligase
VAADALPAGFTFTFMGAEIALLVRKDDYVAYFYPTIDGKQANALPHDTDGNAYLVLRSGDLRPTVDLIPVGSDLSPDQVHSLHVVTDELIPDEIVNRWPLAGIAVSSGDMSRPFNRQIIIGLIAVGIASIAVVMAGRSVKWHIVENIFRRFWVVVGDVGQIIVTFTTSLALLLGMFLTWNDGLPVIFRRDSVQIALSLATAGVIYINKFGVVVTLVAATLLFLFIYNKIELGTMLTLFWAPFFLFPVELYRFAFPIAEIILYITTGAFILRSLVNYAHSRQSTVNLQSRQSLSTTDWLMLAYVMIGFISLSWAENRSSAFTDWRTLFFQPTLFYFILRRTINDSRQLSFHVYSLMLAGFVVSIVGIVMWIDGSAVITAEGGARRLASVYGSPNNVALLLERCIPFLLTFLIVGVKRLRIFALVLLAGIAPAVLLTQSAGALLLAIPFSVVFIMALCWGKRAIVPIVGLCVVVAIGFMIASQTARFERVFDFSSGTSFYRFRVWESALNLIHDHPITGVGLDQFLPAFRERYILPDAWEEPDLSHPHNFILDFWARLGIFGVAIFVGLQFSFWKTAYQQYKFERAKRDPMMYMLTMGAMGSMVALLVHGLVDNSIFVLDLAYIFVFLLCVVEFKQNISAID